MIEAGYRCAICKETSGLQIDHIVEWPKVRKHEFNNMIVLCAVCHARKKNTSDPRHINRASLEQVKSKLMMLNGRDSDLERRIIETFLKKLAEDAEAIPAVAISERLSLLVKYLIDDGIVTPEVFPGPYYPSALPDDPVLSDDTLKLTLTPKGREFIQSLPTAA